MPFHPTAHTHPSIHTQRLPHTNRDTMVHIDEAVKLDFKDVLIRPKRSTLKSRSQVGRLAAR